MLTTKNSQIRTVSGSENGLLVYEGDMLVAVIVHLENGDYDTDQGRWYVEIILGAPQRAAKSFETADEAVERVRTVLEQAASERA